MVWPKLQKIKYVFWNKEQSINSCHLVYCFDIFHLPNTNRFLCLSGYMGFFVDDLGTYLYHFEIVSLTFFVASIKHSSHLGSGCDSGSGCGSGSDYGLGSGSVGRSDASDSRGLRFESSHWQNLCWTMFTVNYIAKTKKREWNHF